MEVFVFLLLLDFHFHFTPFLLSSIFASMKLFPILNILCKEAYFVEELMPAAMFLYILYAKIIVGIQCIYGGCQLLYFHIHQSHPISNCTLWLKLLYWVSLHNCYIIGMHHFILLQCALHRTALEDPQEATVVQL